MTPQADSTTAEPLQRTRRRPRANQDARPGQQPRYHVVLWNDDDHTYRYVITMLTELFGYPAEKGYQLAEEVDTQGRVIVMTTTREHAELKRDQIHAYGKDATIDHCKGSMWATVEATEGE